MARRFALPLPATLVFDAPTTAAITDFIAARLAPPGGAAADGGAAAEAAVAVGGARRRRALRAPLPAAPGAPAPVAAAGPISIVGTVFRPLIAGVDGLEQSGSSGAAGQLAASQLPVCDAIIPVPRSRWEEAAGAGAGAARFGAFMCDIEAFDAAAFGLVPGEALATDPQHRILLEAATELLASFPSAAGAADGSMAGDGLGAWGREDLRSAGVFVGISWTEYHRLVRAHGVPVGAQSALGAVLSVACGRWDGRPAGAGPGLLAGPSRPAQKPTAGVWARLYCSLFLAGHRPGS
jgi:hypothetical protein